MEDPVYLNDEHVLSRMLASEARQELQSYFDNRLQRDFTENDRRELAIWMRDVCQAEECQPDIFPLSMLIVDRFLSFVRTKRTQLQLLGAVSLLLASKLRQTQQIRAKHLIYYTQDLITLNELKTWEFFVLTTLKWDLALITPVDYLDILIKRMKLTDEQMTSEIEEEAQRSIVQCCLDFKYSLYPPSMIAWACLMRAMEPWKLTGDHLYLTSSTKANLDFDQRLAQPMAPHDDPEPESHPLYHHHHHHQHDNYNHLNHNQHQYNQTALEDGDHNHHHHNHNDFHQSKHFGHYNQLISCGSELGYGNGIGTGAIASAFSSPNFAAWN